MRRSKRKFGAAIIAAPMVGLTAGSGYAEQVGGVVEASTSAVGKGGTLRSGSPIARDERVSTNASGRAQIRFIDNTRLVVGPGSSIVINDFVFAGGKRTASKVALSTTKGVFRWISGKSKSAAYKFKTPRGSIGVRGTSFDLYVGPNADKLMIYGGAVRYCTNGGNCKELRGRCQMLIIDESGVHDPVRYNSRRGSGGQFPFIGDAGLQSQFRLGSSSCLSSGRVTPRENDVLDESPGRDDPTPSPTPKASPGDGGSSGGGGTDGGGTGGEVDGD